MLCPFCLEDTMTHKEKEIRNLEIVAKRHAGKSMSELAEEYGLTETGIHHICKRYGVAGKMSNRKAQPKEYRNQYTSGKFDREANAIRYINERTPNFEYAGNFTGIDGYVDLKCKTCGTVITKSFVSVRHGTARCEVCYQRELDEHAEKKKKERRVQAEKDRQSRKFKRLFEMEIEQATFKQCPICNSLFIGNRVYCSEKCRHQNKWQMKDGYRYQFPLEEVYKRDNGICYLCGEPCDWNDYEVKDGVIVYGNNYPSRDHVVPKSIGGSNTWDNIRLAHRICNSLKRNIPLVENFKNGPRETGARAHVEHIFARVAIS